MPMRFAIKNYDSKPDEVKLSCLRLYQWALKSKLKSFEFVIADEFYYDKTLQERRDILSAPSINFLCKTIVFENTAYDQKYAGQFYPKYIAVMVQYVAKIHTEKLNKEMRSYQQKNCPQNKTSKAHFHYRLADQTISAKLTGYEHNGVVPIMFKQRYKHQMTNNRMPIVFSDQIVKLTPQCFWMGAGHPWTKLRMSFKEFVQSYPDKVITLNITYQK